MKINLLGLTQHANLCVKKYFQFGYLGYLNSLIENIFCLDLSMLRKSYLLVCLCTTQLLSATLVFAAPQTDFWQCTASDQGSQTWKAQHPYQQAAINQAFEKCKKLSQTPESCSTSKKACDFFANGTNTTPLWRCIALDQMNKVWQSRLYRKRDDAAIAARAYCEQKSGFPDSCYVNLLTCKTTPETKG